MTEGGVPTVETRQGPILETKSLREEKAASTLEDCVKWSWEVKDIVKGSNGIYGRKSVRKAKILLSKLSGEKSLLEEPFKEGDLNGIQTSVGILGRVLNGVVISTKDPQALKNCRRIILFGRDIVANNIGTLSKLAKSQDIPLESKKSFFKTVDSLFKPLYILEGDGRIPIDFQMRLIKEMGEAMVEQNSLLQDTTLIADFMSSVLFNREKEDDAVVMPFMDSLLFDPNPKLKYIYRYNFPLATREQVGNPMENNVVQTLVGKLLSEYVGQDNSEKMMESWQQAQVIKSDWGGESLYRNLSSLLVLESERPGIGKVLLEQFGISDFGRYPTEMLIAQYDERDETGYFPYGVIINPKSDHNGAFYNNRGMFEKLRRQLKYRSRIRVWEVENTFGLIGALNRARHKYGPISFAIIGGHGEKGEIRFGKKAWLKPDLDKRRGLSQEDVKRKGAPSLKLAFVGNPTIILNSCTTGALGGIGQEMSSIGAKVIAPPEPITIRNIKSDIDEDGTISFKVRYDTETSPQVYLSGSPHAGE